MEGLITETFTLYEPCTPSRPSTPRPSTPQTKTEQVDTAALPSASLSVEFRLPVKLTTCNLNKKKRKVDTNDELIQVALAKLQEKKNDDDDSSAFGVVVATQIKKMEEKNKQISLEN